MTARPSDSDKLTRNDFLAQHGAKLLDNGYQIVPIRQGGKSPDFDGWAKAKASKEQLKEWLDGGHKNAGVGILTKFTPAVDLDIRDPEVSALMVKYVQEKMGGKLLRVGQAPKSLFFFRTDNPMRKRRSTERSDDLGSKNQVEVLGEGQQAVAYHKHPDTGRPYQWMTEGANPLEVRQADLPTLTPEMVDDMLAYFEKLCDARDWDVTKKARGNAKPLSQGNMFEEDTAPVDMTDEEIFAQLMLVPGADDHDQWFQVGMALYHQWDGGETGKQYWHEWSETADNYDREALEDRWKSFSIDGKMRAPVTVRSILKWAADAVEQTKQEEGQRLRTLMASATTLADWEKARKEIQRAEIDPLTRSGLATIAKERREAVTGVKSSIQDIRKALAYVYEAPKGEKFPSWIKDWVYDTSDDKFFNLEQKIAVTQQGFNAMHDRHAMTKKDVIEGRSTPSDTAAGLALSFYKIKTVQGRRYEPGQDSLIYNSEGVFANLYTEKELPELPEKTIPRDVKNINRVKAHLEHLLKDETEQRMLLDWLSWVVQNPGRHVNYAILLQGVEGDGKSFFAEMMRAVMGVSNVTMLNAHIFESDFTDWAAGQCLNCVEEVRIVKAQNKYEVINRLKPYITNNIVEWHPKGKAVVDVKNTTSYLMFSNYQDALPLDDDGRRYLVLFSRWQRRSDIIAFEQANPTYYEKLYGSIEESPGAIRQWLLDHEQAETFRPMGSAPSTRARTFMIKQSKPEFIQELDEVIKENEAICACEELLDVTSLAEVYMARGFDWPNPKTLNSMLQRAGWTELGRYRLNGDSRVQLFSKNPERFKISDDDLGYDLYKLRRFYQLRVAEIDNEL